LQFCSDIPQPSHTHPYPTLKSLSFRSNIPATCHNHTYPTLKSLSFCSNVSATSHTHTYITPKSLSHCPNVSATSHTHRCATLKSLSFCSNIPATSLNHTYPTLKSLSLYSNVLAIYHTHIYPTLKSVSFWSNILATSKLTHTQLSNHCHFALTYIPFRVLNLPPLFRPLLFHVPSIPLCPHFPSWCPASLLRILVPILHCFTSHFHPVSPFLSHMTFLHAPHSSHHSWLVHKIFSLFTLFQWHTTLHDFPTLCDLSSPLINVFQLRCHFVTFP
jgi:hypothetical protein